MPQHIYDEKGNYKGKVLSEKERQEEQAGAAGCLIGFAFLAALALPIYIFYFLVFDLRGKLDKVSKDKNTFWWSVFASLLALTGTGPTKDEKTLFKYSLLIAFLTIITTIGLILVYKG